MLWDRFSDRWLVSQQARMIFGIALMLTILATFAIIKFPGNTIAMSSAARIFYGTIGCAGPAGIFFLWLGMWRYWVRLDTSTLGLKRVWFLLLLLGICYGGCIYYLFGYLPQTQKTGRT